MRDPGTYPTLEALVAAASAAAERVFASSPIVLAYAHGSRIHGTPGPASDLDVGYYLEDFRSGGMLAVAEEMALGDRLSRELGLEVDLRNLGPAPLEVRGRVLQLGARVYSRDEVLRVNLERDCLGRYLDLKESFQRLHAERLRSFAEKGL